MSQKIVMNFTFPPSDEDIEAMAQNILETIPDELVSFCEGVTLQIDDVADEALEQEFELDDPYELLAVYRRGNQIAPGVESKVANDDDVLILFRRAILDFWCESGEDISALLREIIIEEIGKTFDFSEDDIEEMASRHYQGML